MKRPNNVLRFPVTPLTNQSRPEPYSSETAPWVFRVLAVVVILVLAMVLF